MSPKSYSVQEQGGPEEDTYKQGIKNLAFIKSVVREKMAHEEHNPPRIKFVEEHEAVKPKGYL